MPVSLATITPNSPTLRADAVHTIRTASGLGKLVCIAKGCPFAAATWAEALRHTARNQWTASPNLPRELQLTPEQEAA